MQNLTIALKKIVNDVSHTKTRQFVVLSGAQQWAFELLAHVISESDCLWLGDSHTDCGIAMAKAKMVLGREYNQLVFNAYSGFNPEAFGQSVGTLKGGGVCFIIVPPWNEWPLYDDPDYVRYVASPDKVDNVNHFFITRLQRVITEDEQAILIHESDDGVSFNWNSPAELAESKNTKTESIFANEQQAQCVDSIRRVSNGHRNRPLVISADRGRGKSSALGLAAAKLLQEALTHIVVTAPKVSSVDSLFKHAQQLLVGSEIQSNKLHWQDKTIEFIAPDDLISRLPNCDLLMVDEAAAIPTPMLTIIAQRYSRLVFATTIHGYEGTGRGFALRFLKTLKAFSPDMRSFELSKPIRWQDNDAVELITNKALALNFKTMNIDSQLMNFDCLSTDYKIISQLELVKNDALLEQVFGLLVLAHYQTSPSDFRQLLDAPDLYIFIATHKDEVVGVSLVLKEGELESSLSREVALGKRRLRGHLLPQSLLAQMGMSNAAQFSYARIMRIAVHPQLQHSGIGSKLDEFVTQWAGELNIDILGSSFGATSSLTKYWFKNDYSPVRLGFNKDSASGTHALMVLKPLNEKVKRLVADCHQQFRKSFRYDIANHFTTLDASLVITLIAQYTPQTTLDEFERYNLDTYINGARPFEQVGYMLEEIIWCSGLSLATLNDAEQSIIVQRVLQRAPWIDVIQSLGLSGKKEAALALRQAITIWSKT